MLIRAQKADGQPILPQTLENFLSRDEARCYAVAVLKCDFEIPRADSEKIPFAGAPAAVVTPGLLKDMPRAQAGEMLGAQMLLICELLGIRGQNLPTKPAKKAWADWFIQQYPELHVKELWLAFQLVFTDKIEGKDHYQSWDLAYCKRVMDAYKAYRAQTLIKANKLLTGTDKYRMLLQNTIAERQKNHAAQVEILQDLWVSFYGTPEEKAALPARLAPIRRPFLLWCWQQHGFRISETDYEVIIAGHTEVIRQEIQDLRLAGQATLSKQLNDAEGINKDARSRATQDLLRLFFDRYKQAGYSFERLTAEIYRLTWPFDSIAYDRVIQSKEYALRQQIRGKNQ